MERRTWTQLSTLANAIDDKRIADLDLCLIPTIAAAGARFKGYGVQRKRAKARAREKERLAALPPEVAAEAKDKATLDAFAAAGFPVRTVKPEG